MYFEKSKHGAGCVAKAKRSLKANNRLDQTMDQYQGIKILIDKYFAHEQDYRSALYKEASLRQDFLDEMIRLWGWDIGNREERPETFKEVVVEDRVRIDGRMKSPDYCIQLLEKKLFFIEAKKPAVSLGDNRKDAIQVRRYAWTAGHPLCVLTNFREFAVYQTTIPPKETDAPGTGRLFYCTCNEYLAPCTRYPDYPTNWDFILGLFGQKNVLDGSLARYRAPGTARGTSLVDNYFLDDIERWRKILAGNLAGKNNLSVRDLNYAVQVTIDRIIFLHICEDRGIERYGRLEKAAAGKNVYAALFHLFREADTRYDSGLFYFEKERGRSGDPDSITPDLVIDDKTLKAVISDLYPPAPYAFREMPADILGSVYERFLGKAIVLKGKRKVEIEEKPDVKKAGGVYYTPRYIVDYIVKNTLAPVLDGLAPEKFKKFRVLDPACGSGSFLIAVYQYLLNWYLSRYEADPGKYGKYLHKTGSNTYKLTIRERKRILTEHVFGVDIDAQAVEVSKLSLLLKVLEGQSDMELQKTLFHSERALPDLDDNIRCGNSLIGTDYFSEDSGNEKSDDEWLRVNPFDWKEEFPGVFKSKGFDVVVGNPPYGGVLTSEERKHLKTVYEDVHTRTPDKFNYYLSKTFRILKPGGRVGYILPNNLLFQSEYEKTRRFLLNRRVETVLNLGDGVFAGANVPTCILLARKAVEKDYDFHYAELRRSKLVETITETDRLEHVPKRIVLDTPGTVFGVMEEDFPILKKILAAGTPVGQWADEVAAGLVTGGDGIFRMDRKTAREMQLEKALLRPVLKGEEVQRYEIADTKHDVIYTTKKVVLSDYPNTYAYLLPFKEKLSKKRETRNGLIPWWSLHWPRYVELFETEKILLGQTGDSIRAALDKKNYYVLNSVLVLTLNDSCPLPKRAVLAVLNSKLMKFVYWNLTQEFGRAYAEVKPVNIRKLPLPNPETIGDGSVKLIGELCKCVDNLIESRQNRKSEKSFDQKRIQDRKITALENKIEKLVFETFGLSEEERTTIERYIERIQVIKSRGQK